MTENMVTNSSRVLHLISLVSGERLTQLSKSQILKSWVMTLTNQVGLRCPFLDQSTINRASQSQHNNGNCVDGRGGGSPQI